MSSPHYENFPVASLLLPAALREPVGAIYAFARNADDFADEGELEPAERLAALARYATELDAIERNTPASDPVFVRLRPVIGQYGLPLNAVSRPARCLCPGCRQVALCRLCRTVGLLPPFRQSGGPADAASLCPGDAGQAGAVGCDMHLAPADQPLAGRCHRLGKGKHGRVYLPQDDLHRFGVTEAQIGSALCDDNWRALMRFQVGRARDLMLQGAPLGRALPGRVGLEIRAIIAGGLRILEKIEAVDYDVFRRRPTLSASDWPRIIFKAL
jgi:phytoene/squalene synthetase